MNIQYKKPFGLFVLMLTMGICVHAQTKQPPKPKPAPPKKEQNLIVNGDFSKGSIGFISNYTEFNPGVTLQAGVYSVTTNPIHVNGHYCSLTDHTTGTGNLMMIDASERGARDNIWEQTVTVIQNKEYIFTICAASLYAYGDPVTLSVDINGESVVVERLPSGPGVCQWQQYMARWRSGKTTKAMISIYGDVAPRINADLALDDVRFFEEGKGSTAGYKLALNRNTIPEEAPVMVEMVGTVGVETIEGVETPPVDVVIDEPVSQIGVEEYHPQPPPRETNKVPVADNAASLPKGRNLIMNGGFEEGNMGFISAYEEIHPGTACSPGHFMITTDSYNMNGHYWSVQDCVTKNGNVMVVDGGDDYARGLLLWAQTVKVEKDRKYTFSINTASLYDSGDPAIIVVEINNERKLYHPLPQGDRTGQWQQYQFTWESGKASVAAIVIYSASKAYLSNDFAIDNLGLYETK